MGKGHTYNAGDPDSTPRWEDPVEKGLTPHSRILEISVAQLVKRKSFPHEWGDLGSILSLGRSPGEGEG